MNLRTLPFWLVDVFAREPLAGNSLSVFLLDDDLTFNAMQRITQEMRQFETIFLRRVGETSRFNVRIFTMEEELLFAGHPIIGAAALMHAELFPADEVSHFEFITSEREIPVISRRKNSIYFAEMDQGVATTVTSVPHVLIDGLAQAFSLSISDLAADMPLQVVSTGLPYLIVPIRTNLERAQIIVPDFEALLTGIGAKFVYVFDVGRWEGRTWDNDGQVEDIATVAPVVVIVLMMLLPAGIGLHHRSDLRPCSAAGLARTRSGTLPLRGTGRAGSSRRSSGPALCP